MLLATGLVVVALIGTVVWYFNGPESGTLVDTPLLSAVQRGPYEHAVLEQGEVESSNNVEIRCEVKNRSGGNSPSTTVLDVVPEGTHVKKGDWLITFDSSLLDNELRQQRIGVNKSKILVIQAKAMYDTAVIARKEYVEGTYQQERKTIRNEIFLAKENLEKAQLSFESIRRSVARGRMDELQLRGEQFRVDAAKNDLDLANQKLEVLDNYTKEKMLTQLNSDVEATKVTWENEEASYKEELSKLEEINEQITRCKVTAPQAGQVVYANVQSSRSSSEFVVEPGAAVRERQVIIRLPDPNNMQVRAKINEARINLVQIGMPVSIVIDAFGDRVLRGEVTKVNKYAEPGNWWSSTAKEYITLIRILDPPPEIRSGLTAAVRIQVDHRDNVLQVPVQAVCEHDGQTFCLVKNGAGWATRRVVIDSTNDKMVALDEAASEPLDEGALVALNARQYSDLFDFSAYPESAEPQAAVASSPAQRVGAEAGAESEKAASDEADTGASQTAGDHGVATRRGDDAGTGRKVAGRQPGAEAGSGSDRKQRSPAALFRRLDSDGDGRISSAELQRLPEAFRNALTGGDANGDGSIDQAELARAAAKLRGQPRRGT